MYAAPSRSPTCPGTGFSSSGKIQLLSEMCEVRWEGGGGRTGAGHQSCSQRAAGLRSEMDVQVSRPTEMSADNTYVASAHFSSRS